MAYVGLYFVFLERSFLKQLAKAMQDRICKGSYVSMYTQTHASRFFQGQTPCHSGFGVTQSRYFTLSRAKWPGNLQTWDLGPGFALEALSPEVDREWTQTQALAQ